MKRTVYAAIRRNRAISLSIGVGHKSEQEINNNQKKTNDLLENAKYTKKIYLPKKHNGQTFLLIKSKWSAWYKLNVQR